MICKIFLISKRGFYRKKFVKNITIFSGAAVDYEGNKTPEFTTASFTLSNTDKVAPVIGATISTAQVVDGGSVKYTVKVADNGGIESFI